MKKNCSLSKQQVTDYEKSWKTQKDVTIDIFRLKGLFLQVETSEQQRS